MNIITLPKIQKSTEYTSIQPVNFLILNITLPIQFLKLNAKRIKKVLLLILEIIILHTLRNLNP